MSYKINGLPSKKAYKEETADFWEIEAIRNPDIFVSNISINKIIAKEFDELNNEGIGSEEDEYDVILDDVFAHLKDRVHYTDSNYPFNFGSFSISVGEIKSISSYLYLFLLLSTRFDMNKDKIQNGIDGTKLFEHISANAAKNFFGRSAESIVFGTGVSGGFENKVKDLIVKIGEGGMYRNPNSNPVTKNDDGIDVVVWKEFADKKQGKLIGFCQCKTGTSWKDDIHKLKPVKFCDSWFSESPIFSPIPIIFITDVLKDFNYYTTSKGLLFFDRFRIIEYGGDELLPEIIDKIKTWVDAAIKSIS